MGYQSDHIYYVFGGGMPGGEQWTTGLRTQAAVVVLESLQGLCQAASESFRTRIFGANAGIKEFNTAEVTYLGCTAYLVPQTGKATVVARSDVSQATAGNATTQTAPNQTAIVASLRSARAGRSNRGRMYLPMVAPVFTATGGRLNTGLCNVVASAVAHLVSDIAASANTSPAAGPFPVAIQSKTEAGTPARVISVYCGNVADTQRRRRDKLIEQYSASPVIFPS